MKNRLEIKQNKIDSAKKKSYQKTEDIQKNQIETLELKNTKTEIKNSVDGGQRNKSANLKIEKQE